MQAMVQDTYGSAEVMHLRNVDKPQIGEDEVLIRVRAAGVNPADWAIMSGLPYIARPVYGLRKPKQTVRGTDVVRRGRGRRRERDAVPAGRRGLRRLPRLVRRIRGRRRGHAGLKPVNLTFEQAAAVPMAGLVALQAIRDHGHVQAGQTVLINGASGGIGTFAVQIAKALGAQVTGVTQHGERRAGPLDRRRPRHRLHQGGLHAERRAVRLHPRQRVEPLAVRPAPRADPDGHAHPERRRVRQSLARQRRPDRPRGRAVPVRQPDAGQLPHVDERTRTSSSSRSSSKPGRSRRSSTAPIR